MQAQTSCFAHRDSECEGRIVDCPRCADKVCDLHGVDGLCMTCQDDLEKEEEMTVAEEITSLNRQAEAIRRARIEMEAELEEIERTSKQLRCECDGDYDYETGRTVACHSVICPIHDVCQDCDDAKPTEIVEGRKVCADCAKGYEPLKGRWAKSSGGWCLEIQNDEFHFCDPLGWRIIGFITPNARRTGYLLQITGDALALDFGRLPRHSFETLAEAQAAAIKATGVEVA